MMCRQCPGYRKELSSALWICEPAQSEGSAKVPGDGPSTSSDTSIGYSCSLLCLNDALTHTNRHFHTILRMLKSTVFLLQLLRSSDVLLRAVTSSAPAAYSPCLIDASSTFPLRCPRSTVSDTDTCPLMSSGLLQSPDDLLSTPLNRYGVPEAFLSCVLGLPEDRLSRLPSTFQR